MTLVCGVPCWGQRRGPADRGQLWIITSKQSVTANKAWSSSFDIEQGIRTHGKDTSMYWNVTQAWESNWDSLFMYLTTIYQQQWLYAVMWWLVDVSESMYKWSWPVLMLRICLERLRKTTEICQNNRSTYWGLNADLQKQERPSPYRNVRQQGVGWIHPTEDRLQWTRPSGSMVGNFWLARRLLAWRKAVPCVPRT